MIFAAGLGTRLRPLTNEKPKALVGVNNRTMLDHTLSKLVDDGIERIVINVHHFADLVISHLEDSEYDCDLIISDERDELLDTGGGLKAAREAFDLTSPILLHNADILTTLLPTQLLKVWEATQPLTLLAVRDRNSSRKLLVNQDDALIGWRNTKTQETRWCTQEDANASEVAFSGVHVVSPEWFDRCQMDGIYSITESYLRLATNHRIEILRHDTDAWYDVGSLEKLKAAEAGWNT